MAAANNKSPIHGAANNSPAIDNNSSTKDKMAAAGGPGDEKENGYEAGIDGEVAERKKPVDIRRTVTTKLVAVRDVLWNGQKRELIGRTWDSWGKQSAPVTCRAHRRVHRPGLFGVYISTRLIVDNTDDS